MDTDEFLKYLTQSERSELRDIINGEDPGDEKLHAFVKQRAPDTPVLPFSIFLKQKAKTIL